MSKNSSRGSASNNKSVATGGIGLGNIIAMFLSYRAFKSIPWLIFHGLLGWIYVIYYVIKYGIG